VQKYVPAGVTVPVRNGIAITLVHLATQSSDCRGCRRTSVRFAGFRPSTGAAVVVLTNSAGRGSDDIGFHLLNAAFPREQSERGDTGRAHE